MLVGLSGECGAEGDAAGAPAGCDARTPARHFHRQSDLPVDSTFPTLHLVDFFPQFVATAFADYKVNTDHMEQAPNTSTLAASLTRGPPNRCGAQSAGIERARFAPRAHRRPCCSCCAKEYMADKLAYATSTDPSAAGPGNHEKRATFHRMIWFIQSYRSSLARTALKTGGQRPPIADHEVVPGIERMFNA